MTTEIKTNEEILQEVEWVAKEILEFQGFRVPAGLQVRNSPDPRCEAAWMLAARLYEGVTDHDVATAYVEVEEIGEEPTEDHSPRTNEDTTTPTEDGVVMELLGAKRNEDGTLDFVAGNEDTTVLVQQSYPKRWDVKLPPDSPLKMENVEFDAVRAVAEEEGE